MGPYKSNIGGPDPSALIVMNFTVRWYAERGYATVYRLSLRVSVRLSVTFRCRDHIGRNTSKITQTNSLRFLLKLTQTAAIWRNGNTPKIRVE